MNQTTATTLTDTHPVSGLEEDVKYYRDAGFQKWEEAHERLLHTLQTNDCREIITAVVNGEDLASVFVVAGGRGHIDILQAFLNHGMNIDVKDKSGGTALMDASCSGYEQCVQFLLDHNASVDVQNSFGMSALMYASLRGKTKIVEMLLEKNANLDLQSNRGMTALMNASSYGNKEMVELLLDHGVNIELRNNDGKTALDVAKIEEIKEMIRNHVSTRYVLK